MLMFLFDSDSDSDSMKNNINSQVHLFYSTVVMGQIMRSVVSANQEWAECCNCCSLVALPSPPKCFFSFIIAFLELSFQLRHLFINCFALTVLADLQPCGLVTDNYFHVCVLQPQIQTDNSSQGKICDKGQKLEHSRTLY